MPKATIYKFSPAECEILEGKLADYSAAFKEKKDEECQAITIRTANLIIEASKIEDDETQLKVLQVFNTA